MKPCRIMDKIHFLETLQLFLLHPLYFVFFAFFTFRSSWLLAAGLIYLFALGFNVYHVMYLGGEVQTQLFVEVVLSVWILGTALLMRSAANSKPVVKEATADTE